jgi:hypothetical protein
MTLWLIHKEKIHHHAKFMAWKTSGQPPPQRWSLSVATRHLPPLKFTKHPSRKAVSLDELRDAYGATLIREALADFFIELQHPDYSHRQVENEAAFWTAPFHTVAVFHKVKLHSWDEQGYTGILGISDSIHV